MEFTNVIQFLNDFGRELVNKCKSNIIKYDAVKTGELLNSVRYIFSKKNASFEISIEMAEYWKYVENGRKSGRFPPLKNIRKWVMVKPSLPRPHNGKLPSLKGIKPRPFFKDSLDDVMNDFESGLEDAFTKDVENEMDKITVLLTTYKK